MNNISLPLWRQKLKASQSKESKLISNRWIQLANISKNNQPRVRTVVFRGWLENNDMLIYTDKRSEKFEDLEINNNVEVLWLFLKSKSQYRFKGTAHKIADDDKYWNNLSDKSKITWFWSTPRKKIIKNETAITVNEMISKPNNFLALKIIIDEVDLLKLENPVHKRFIWKKNNDWECIEVNP
tara:strand:+ start:729 stop:1277 length:549 start_codon:yes stop_codon:yes gene_type:complete